MKNNKKLLFILPLLLLGACSKRSEPKLVFDKWSVKEKNPLIVERKLAAATDAECMYDTFTEDTLKAEIASIEQKYKGEKKLQGSYQHLDFADLPVMQGKYLQTYGKSLGDLSGEIKFDFKGCSDVPCIINKIYGQDGGVEGYAIYLWYLKMGHTLAVDNMVPEQASKTAGVYLGKKIRFEDYLFSKDELYGFWRLSHMLKSPFTNLPLIKEIQRIPKGLDIENSDPTTCGTAFSQWSSRGLEETISGSIVLNDGCLVLNSSNKDSGHLYASVTHELSHLLDFKEGFEKKSFSRKRSYQPDWLNLSGWTFKEQREKDNTVTRVYSIQTNFTKFVTSYAMGSPSETFAETLAYYLHQGDMTKGAILPELYDLVKKDYYSQEEYTLDENINHIVASNAKRFTKEVLDLSLSCLEPKSPTSTYFKGISFNEKIPPLMLSCMGALAESIEATMLAFAKIHDPNGCEITKIKINGNTKLKTAWKKYIASQIDDSFSKMKNDSQYLARIKQFYEKVSEDKTPPKLYVSCYGEENEKLCYEKKLKDHAEEKVSTLKTNQAQHDELINIYVDSFPFETVQSTVTQYYTNFSRGQVAVISETAEALWKGCLAVAPDDKEDITGTLFNVGTGYLVSSAYNCINYNLPSKVKDLIRGLEIDGQKVESGKEELILTNQLIPLLVIELRVHLSEAASTEKVKIDEYINSHRDDLKSRVRSDFKWATDYVDNDQIGKDCLSAALDQIEIELYFNKKKAVMDSLISEVCTDISKAPEFTKYLESIRGDLEAKSFQTLEDNVLEEGMKVGRACVQLYPINTAINKAKYRKEREDCLVKKWATIEAAGLKKLNSEPLVIKFKIDTSSYAEKVKKRSRVLQVKVIKALFD